MSRFVLRKNQRFRQSVPVLYSGEGVSGEGMAKDLSLSGWKVKGNEQVSAGMLLVLRVFLPDNQEPLRIERATVQWVKGLEFGVAFDGIPRKEQDRIKQVIDDLVHKQHGSAARGKSKRPGKA